MCKVGTILDSNATRSSLSRFLGSCHSYFPGRVDATIMSNLRKRAKKDKDSQAKGDTSAPRGRGASYNPVFLAKLIFRKVLDILTSSDEDDITQPGGIISLLKDIVVGITLGVMTISALIFLDHRNVIHFQSARNFRNSASALLNDLQIIANIEESSGLEFMTVEECESEQKETDAAEAKVTKASELVQTRIKEAKEKHKEVDSIKAGVSCHRENSVLICHDDIQ